MGAQIRTLREKNGVSRAELGSQTNFSGSAIGAFERGDWAIDPGMVVQLDEIFNANGVLMAVVPYLEEERHSPQYSNFTSIEAKAVSLWVYSTHMLHGLLQTEAYARRLFEAYRPTVPAEEIEKRLADRLVRQKLLHRDPAPELCFVIEQSVLLRKTGGESVWRDQIRHLLEVGRLPHVCIQVVPLDCEEPVGSDGSMTLVEVPQYRMVGYVEVQEHSWLIQKPEAVSGMVQRHASIRGLALTPRESTHLIEQLLGER
ncbi:helix-turn-helix domain-containing protein [Streptomyces sp. NPDC058304]|uniref:helix-turn-helix domain-containing protein n=1 Tax=Streptomyces sp. NPDC058304 TaxID=3346437 RepID=UPI0036E131DA